MEAPAQDFQMPGHCGKGLLFAEGKLLAGINPLLQDDLAVFAFADVHGVRPLFQVFRHFFGHVDTDGLGAFSDWIRRPSKSPPL
ncbi:MAG: hypothetical protein PHP93_08855 [Kiritimatiellales bacterium]|nr:hypothetical protein [Kiritimatiellales bacterium]